MRSRRVVLDRALFTLAYRCAGGCPRDRTCCVGLAVEVTRREVRAIDAVMDETAHLAPGLRDRRGYANVFVDDPPGLLIEAKDDGACPFLYRAGRRALCAIHAVALRSGRRVASVKPAACRHWPLVLEAERGRVRLTVQAAALRIGCVAPTRELPGHPLVVDAFREEIAEICGGQAPRVRRKPASRRIQP